MNEKRRDKTCNTELMRKRIWKGKKRRGKRRKQTGEKLKHEEEKKRKRKLIINDDMRRAVGSGSRKGSVKKGGKTGWK